MTYKEKYKQLIKLLEEVGIMQLDTPWAIEIRDLVKEHKKIKEKV